MRDVYSVWSRSKETSAWDLVCDQTNPITCGELLPPLLNFALDALNELEQIDRCFDLSHQETVDSVRLDSLLKDIKHHWD